MLVNSFLENGVFVTGELALLIKEFECFFSPLNFFW